MKFLITLLFRLLQNHVPVQQAELNQIHADAEAWVLGITPEKNPMLNKALVFCDNWYVKLAGCILYLKMMREIPRWLAPPKDEEEDREDD